MSSMQLAYIGISSLMTTPSTTHSPISKSLTFSRSASYITIFQSIWLTSLTRTQRLLSLYKAISAIRFTDYSSVFRLRNIMANSPFLSWSLTAITSKPHTTTGLRLLSSQRLAMATQSFMHLLSSRLKILTTLHGFFKCVYGTVWIWIVLFSPTKVLF